MDTEATSPVDALVRRAQQGDRAALEAVLAAVAPAVARFSARMCKNAHDADDVVQDTLLSVAQNLRGFEGRSSITSWVFVLARSACAHRRRGLKNQPPVSDEHIREEPDGARSPEDQAEAAELITALSHALGALSDEHREVILLRDVEGLSAPEAAEVLGISIDALKSRLHRAREALRSQMRPFSEPLALRPQPGCPDVAEMWSRKLEGDLSQGDCASMEKHIAGCPSCGSSCDALRKALLACQSVKNAAVPPAVQAMVKQAVRAFAPHE
jgi:RNA polymerase sigma-70 factor (ECF subfamily)